MGASDKESGDVRSSKKLRKEKATEERVKGFIGHYVYFINYGEIYFNQFAVYLLIVQSTPKHRL